MIHLNRVSRTPCRSGNRIGALLSAVLTLLLTLLPAIASTTTVESTARSTVGNDPLLVSVYAGTKVYRGTQAGRRIVAIADVHGAWDAFTSILKEVGLVDADLNWAAGETVFVQTGDVADRGPKVRACLDLLMRLQEQAPEQGGEVIVVFGNHEAMNVVDFLRDGSPDDFAAFTDENSEKRQEEEYEAWVELRTQRAKDLDEGQPRFTREIEREWKDTHPPGYFERMEAFGPEGHYGSWLRQLPTAARIGNLLFMHAGLNPEFGDLSADEINEKVWAELRRYDEVRKRMVAEGLITPYADLVDMIGGADAKLVQLTRKYPPGARPRPSREEQQLARELSWVLDYQQWQMLTRNGLLWFRGLAQWPEDEHTGEVAELLDKRGVDHIILGHSVQLDGNIRTRFGGRVFLNDTGMLASAYNGRPSALEIEGGRFTAVYVGERQTLWPAEAGPRAAPAQRPSDGTRRAPAAAIRLTGYTAEALHSSWRQIAGANATGSLRWRGPDGGVLPFESEDELLEFLREAPIVDSQKLETGITGAHRLELEADGVRLRAIYHTIDLRRERARVNGRFHTVFRDSWRGQVAAYRLARLLGIATVPPTVQRKIGEDYGSVQLWLENDGLMSNSERIAQRIRPADLQSWLAQQWIMNVFDALIFNDDRNTGNVLVDGEWTMWLIDHTRAFQREPEIRDPDDLSHIERQLWNALNRVSDDELRDAVRLYIEPDQVNGLLARRTKIVEHFAALIERLGEDQVLYDLPTGAPGRTLVRSSDRAA